MNPDDIDPQVLELLDMLDERFGEDFTDGLTLTEAVNAAIEHAEAAAYDRGLENQEECA